MCVYSLQDSITLPAHFSWTFNPVIYCFLRQFFLVYKLESSDLGYPLITLRSGLLYIFDKQRVAHMGGINLKIKDGIQGLASFSPDTNCIKRQPFGLPLHVRLFSILYPTKHKSILDARVDAFS